MRIFNYVIWFLLGLAYYSINKWIFRYINIIKKLALDLTYKKNIINKIKKNKAVLYEDIHIINELEKTFEQINKK